MSDTPDLGPVPRRVSVDAAQVHTLIAAQFPGWANLPVEPVADSGWDNCTFHLGDELVVRLPSAAEYAEAVEKEQQWLPVLAPQLPLPIPMPVAQGAPSPDFPYPWSVYQWIDGQTASPERVADPRAFAIDLAGFLSALQGVDSTGGPQPGIHNWFRGGTLRTYDANTRRAVEALEGHVDVDAVRHIWSEALSETWDGTDRWFHGDVAEGNLLLNDAGQLHAVIDFGTCGVGDPACDLAVAWTLLTTEGRDVFRDRLQVKDPDWARGRGWALWKTTTTCWHTFDNPDDQDDFERAKRTLSVILQDG